MVYLFVYGLLRYGFSLYYRFLKDVRFVGLARIDGYLMYDLGGYPAIVRRDATVYGEVYDVETGTIYRLDMVEAEYDRVEVDAYFIGDLDLDDWIGPYKVSLYVYRDRPMGIRINSGDYSTYKSGIYTLNLFLPEGDRGLIDRSGVEPLSCIDARAIYSGRHIHGGLYRLENTQVSILDRHIGLGGKYRRTIKVIGEDGYTYFGFTYIGESTQEDRY